RNTVVIMTSNVGARQIIGDKKIGFSKTENRLSKEEIRSSAMEELKKIMNPEMINRLDDIVVFSPLSPAQIEEIVDLQLSEMRERLAEIGDDLKISSAAKKYFSENGYEVQYGARPIRRLLQKKVEDVIADKLLELDGKKVIFSIGVKNGDIHISAKVQKEEIDFTPSGLLPMETQNSQTV
ncbi:MAG: ATP-dependent Clp protease ATP-binding subunit, partial [Spirochaetaceae bacterium]|nr:ATP-dependent Clp protease ATP-binding subunit [Spirochaetaceae bacterium]